MSNHRLPLRMARLAALLAVALGNAHAAGNTATALPDSLRAGLIPRDTPRVRTATAPPAPALTAGATINVTSCADDDGFDTLRHAALVANSGDTIDLSGLSCSAITLEKGEIAIGIADLTIVGPGRQLAIDGANTSRVFNHTGLGLLALSGLTIRNGKRDADKAYGGCMISQGDIAIDDVAITGCTALGQTKAAAGAVVVYGDFTAAASTISGNSAIATVGKADDLSAAGGAVFAQGALQVFRSTVSGNSAQAPVGKVYGGGLLGGISTVVKYSTISDNEATSGGSELNYAYGGGMAIVGDLTILASTIDHNTADAAGGIAILGGDVYSAAITASTISANDGRLGEGALSATTPISIDHSTIAFNLSGPKIPVAVILIDKATLNSTIVADNPGSDFASSVAVAGGHNLIKIKEAATVVPLDTITLDPNLGPLAFNGGPTRTHTLVGPSPAINAGQATSLFYEFDQRGSTYARVVGSATDIGAIEVDSDHIFGSGNEYPLAE